MFGIGSIQVCRKTDPPAQEGEVEARIQLIAGLITQGLVDQVTRDNPSSFPEKYRSVIPAGACTSDVIITCTSPGDPKFGIFNPGNTFQESFPGDSPCCSKGIE